MRLVPSRAAAFVLVLAVPTASAASERPPSLLVKRAQEPVAPAPAPIELLPAAPPVGPALPPVAAPPLEPTPAEPVVAEPVTEVPTPEVSTEQREEIYEVARAENTRDLGASAMLGTGLLTVGGVVLILAGFGATSAALNRSDCDSGSCADQNRKVLNAARVTVAGLAISTIGALGFIASAAVYGVGNARVQRLRRDRPALTLAPSRSGAALSLAGRF